MRTVTQVRKLLDHSASRIHKDFAARRAGKWFLKEQMVTREEVDFQQLAELARNDGRLFATKGMVPGRYWSLHEASLSAQDPENGVVWMSTHVPERETNIEFLRRAKGRVLIAGLGMGLILWPLSKMRNVGPVYVVEKNIEVVKLLRPHVQKLNLQINLTHQDIHAYKPPTERFFDTIYFDIWPTITAGNIPEVIRLKKKFKPYLADDGWMGAWVEEELFRQAKKHKELKKTFPFLRKFLVCK